MSTNLAAKKPKKYKQFSDMIEHILNILRGSKGKNENEEFIRMIFEAKQEMLDAQCYFDNITTPELVDYAIYKMEAAKSQYIYLLKLAKDKGLNGDI